jgi:hypothetical protein
MQLPLRSPVIEDPAKRRDLHAQIAVLNHSRWPDGSDDLAPRHEIAGPPDQHAENIERARADRHRRENAALVAPVQIAAGSVETEAFEPENVVHRERVPVCTYHALPNFLKIYLNL